MNIGAKHYRCLKKKAYTLEQYSLVPMRKVDMELIRKWRNEQIYVLRQKNLLTKKEQKNYYEKYIEPSFEQLQPTQILLSYLLDNKIIGYGGFVHIDWLSKKSEISFLLNGDRSKDKNIYKKEFSMFLSLIKQVAFMEISFNKLYAETYDIRPLHIKILEDNGFKLEGRLKDHVIVNNKYVDLLIHEILKSWYKD